MKILAIASIAMTMATASFADHYSHGHGNRYDNPRFEQEADWVRNQHKYKRQHARDYYDRKHDHHRPYHHEQSSSDANLSFMLGIILGAMAAQN